MSQTVSRLEEVTPIRARHLLGLIKNNRLVSPARVAMYAEAMKRGEWFSEVSAIWLNGNGEELIDGQHRLHAVIEYGKPVLMRINRGAPRQLKYAIDTGRARSFSDVLKMEGFQRAPLLAAAAKLEYEYCQNPAMTKRGALAIPPTHLQLLAMVQERPGLQASTEFIMSMKKRFAGWYPTSFGAFLHYRFCQAADDKSASWFWGRMADGTEVDAEHPITRLRQYIMEKKRTKQVSLSRRFTLAITIKAWNAYLMGETPSRVLYWKPMREQFPRIFEYEEESE